MNLKIIFKRLILLDIIIGILSLTSSFYMSEKLINLNQELFPVSLKISFIYLIVMLVWIVNDILLYKFKKIAKQIFIILFAISIIFSFIISGVVHDSMFYLLNGLAWSINGAILVFLYFTPIKKEFDK